MKRRMFRFVNIFFMLVLENKTLDRKILLLKQIVTRYLFIGVQLDGDVMIIYRSFYRIIGTSLIEVRRNQKAKKYFEP